MFRALFLRKKKRNEVPPVVFSVIPVNYSIITVPPIITRPPQDKDVEEDGRVDLQCQVDADTAYPVTTVIWMKNEQLIKSVSFIGILVNVTTGSQNKIYHSLAIRQNKYKHKRNDSDLSCTLNK